jgi:hypothetical protein
MNKQVLDRSYKSGDLTIEIHRIPTQHGYRLSVSAWCGEFFKKKDVSRHEFGDGVKVLHDFEAAAALEYQEHLVQMRERGVDHDVERYIDAALQHGEDSEPDHEVGDLQDYLRVMWDLLTPEQQSQFARDERVVELLESGGFDAGASPGR